MPESKLYNITVDYKDATEGDHFIAYAPNPSGAVLQLMENDCVRTNVEFWRITCSELKNTRLI